MSQNEHDEAFALSPYDSDLRPDDGEVRPDDVPFETPAGYEEPTDVVAGDESPADEGVDPNVEVVLDDPIDEYVEPEASSPPAPFAEPAESFDEAGNLAAADGPARDDNGEPFIVGEMDVIDERVGESPSDESGDDVSSPESAEDELRRDEDLERVDTGEPAAESAVDAEKPVLSDDAAATEVDAAAPADAEDSLTDTAVRRTSLFHPEPAPLPSNEPTALRDGSAVDERVANYGTTLSEEDAYLFEGSAYDRVPPRWPAHIWSILAMLLLLPVAWYLVADAGARMTISQDPQWTTGNLDIAALVEMLGGLAIVVVLFMTAAASGLGAIIFGSLTAIFGAIYVVTPGFGAGLMASIQSWLIATFSNGALGVLGDNAAYHLEADAASGRLLKYGIVILLLGIVSMRSRARGRDEQVIRAQVERRARDRAKAEREQN